ncbi:helix-turn-helix transcriptional regulator [Salmonella enterica]|uniref:AraC family transcriptional regulator n=3 Tax=Salmonella enterica TaxID=28901 RepID=A0A613QAE3_SALER|nr:helix-turn-helix transcriptional regulator [Salmonella enterica]EBH2884338.1 helix-turn-helix transcriptional regulator [Salmonella enterica subsp. enterica]EBH8574280.1 AraC family transcriptional regulator [Salmonella enterica subsp. enterica serovar Braenderup]EBW8522128.1 AraC family transcriptional regulator [Salmonella enterica subsp. enterica serovar Haardt]ECY3940004.1 helix-turn-helix transcriptional regulator [Salmonella enterica subsp. enterica serovar Kallo]EAA1571845.1 AraC fam
MIGLRLDGYDPDLHHDAAVAFCIRARDDELFSPRHQHRKGQLILALHGAITCEVENAMWMVPPQYAVWLPGSLPHSNHVTAGAELCFLFIEPAAVVMPERCCTLKISPLCRELILSLARRTDPERAQMPTQRLIQVLFDELPQQPQEQLQLPVSGHPKIRQMVETMAQEPARWNTLGQWASVFAMSERNLARLIVKETGLSFRRWRHQLQLILALQALIAGRNVQQTAQMLGYDSTTAFITMFKKGLGQTPGQYLTGELLLPHN